MSESISVVMPYYKNERTLVASLKSFAAQDEAAEEIIVVDDGGPVRAAEVCQNLKLKVPLTLLRTHRAGQSKATNQGIVRARGDIIMLTCADIIACPAMLAAHLKVHAKERRRAVLGYIPYAASVKMTPFMQFLRTSGVQFDFAAIDDVDDVNCLSLYAPNVSVRAEHLRALGGFNEAFTYGYQDTDLGLRLAAMGVRLAYCSEAVGFHDHPNTLGQFVARQELMGAAALTMLRLHPAPAFFKIFESGAAFALPRLKLLEGLIDEAGRIEAALALRPALLRAMRLKLFELYKLILLLAIFRGALRQRHNFPAALRHKIDAWLQAPLDAQSATTSAAPVAAAHLSHAN